MSEVWIFPGQGSQYPGMGRPLYDASAEARDILQTGELLAELPLAKITLHGPRQALTPPMVLEPAIVALEIAYIEELRSCGLYPDIVAGYSLGEVAALYCAEVITLQEALQIAVVRGRALQKISDESWRMVTVSGLPLAEVEAIISNVDSSNPLRITAYDAPLYFAITGKSDAVLEAEARITARGGLTSQVAVAGPWHCSVAMSAAVEIANALEEFDFRRPKVPVYCSSIGAVMTNPKELRRCLADQIRLPILWNAVLGDLWGRGVRRSLEVGPGHTLTGFVRRAWPHGLYQARFLERENGKSLPRELCARHRVRRQRKPQLLVPS